MPTKWTNYDHKDYNDKKSIQNLVDAIVTYVGYIKKSFDEANKEAAEAEKRSQGYDEPGKAAVRAFNSTLEEMLRKGTTNRDAITAEVKKIQEGRAVVCKNWKNKVSENKGVKKLLIDSEKVVGLDESNIKTELEPLLKSILSTKFRAKTKPNMQKLGDASRDWAKVVKGK